MLWGGTERGRFWLKTASLSHHYAAVAVAWSDELDLWAFLIDDMIITELERPLQLLISACLSLFWILHQTSFTFRLSFRGRHLNRSMRFRTRANSFLIGDTTTDSDRILRLWHSHFFCTIKAYLNTEQTLILVLCLVFSNIVSVLYRLWSHQSITLTRLLISIALSISLVFIVFVLCPYWWDLDLELLPLKVSLK